MIDMICDYVLLGILLVLWGVIVFFLIHNEKRHVVYPHPLMDPFFCCRSDDDEFKYSCSCCKGGFGKSRYYKIKGNDDNDETDSLIA